MNKLYDDPEFREKVASSQNEIKNIKERHQKLSEEHKELKLEQNKVIAEMTKLNNAKRKLRERKIDMENGIKNSHKSSKIIDLEEEATIIKQRNKQREALHEKNENRVKLKVVEKERTAKQLEEEIKETRRLLEERTKDNERLSQESKQLKAMIPKKSLKDSFAKDNSVVGDHKHDLGVGSDRHGNSDHSEERDIKTPQESIGL